MIDKVKRIGGWQYVAAAAGLLMAVAAMLWAALNGWPDRAYWCAAVGASAFYGFACLAIWRQPEPSDTNGPLWPWRVHLWWFNGMGSFAGFYATHILKTRLSQQGDLGWAVFVLGLVAMLGMGGWLPYAVMGFAQGLRQLANKAIEAVAPSAPKADG